MPGLKGLLTKLNESGLTPKNSKDDTSLQQYKVDAESEDFQVENNGLEGVKKAEAVNQVWPKEVLYGLYAWLWVCFFILQFQSSIYGQVIYYAYSSFASAPEISTASILSIIIGGVVILPVGKIITLWGRSESLILFLVVYLVGIIVVATCNNPNSYAAGYVLYTVGYNSINLVLSVFIADTSGLKNRAFAFAYISTPTIATAYVGPLAAQSFIIHSSWRWSIGIFGFIVPVVLIPIALTFKYYEKKAKNLGVLKKENSGRTLKESIIHYIHDFDLVGAFFLMAAFVIFLLPFSMNVNGKADFKSGTFIAMVIVGALLFPTFALWEAYGAKTQFIPWDQLRDPTVLGACVLSFVVFFTYYCWDLYFYYFAIVVYNMSISNVGYLVLTYTVMQCVWCVIFGMWVRYRNKFKYTCLFFGVPMQILGSGLMIHFRGEESNVGYIVMCQIFMAVAGGTLIIGCDMAVMAASNMEGVPMMLALLSIFGSIGGGIGNTVAVSIYGHVFPSALLKALPDEYKDQYLEISAGGYITQMMYLPGTEVRIAINYAWGRLQRMECIVATAVMVVGFPAVAIWKNYSVDKKVNKGVVL